MRGIFKREKDEEGGEAAVAGQETAADANGAHPVREFLERSQQTFDEWQKRVDERIRTAVESLSPLSSIEKEMRALSQRLADLEKKLEERE
jgi:uncharacterized coiled-coil DUF342 family protein